MELSRPTVIKIIRQFASEISKLKRTEIEELLHLYHFTLRERIRTFGKIQGILLAELETRSVKDIATDKLIDLIIKCDKADADPDGKLGKAGLY